MKQNKKETKAIFAINLMIQKHNGEKAATLLVKQNIYPTEY